MSFDVWTVAISPSRRFTNSSFEHFSTYPLLMIILHVCNALVIFWFVAIVTLIAVTYNSDPSSNSDNVYDQIWVIVQTCSICGQTAAITFAVYSFVTLTSIFGILAIYSRDRCMLTTYASMALTTVTFMIAITSVILVIDQSHLLDNTLYQLWDGVEPAGKCNIETIIGCSGWYNVCVVNETYNIYNDSAPNSSADVIGTGLIVPDGCADCGAFLNEQNTNCPITCHAQFYKYWGQYVCVPVAPTTTAIMLLSAIAAVVAFKIRANTDVSATQGEVLGLLNTEYKP